MTIAEVETKARRIIEDTLEPYRCSHEEICEYLQDAVRRLNQLAPATRYIDGALTDGVELPEAEDEDFPVNPRYREALAYYVAYLFYINDATDTMNAERAASCLTRAEGMMV